MYGMYIWRYSPEHGIEGQAIQFAGCASKEKLMAILGRAGLMTIMMFGQNPFELGEHALIVNDDGEPVFTVGPHAPTGKEIAWPKA